MPDWITHAVAAYLLASGLRTGKKSLVVLGGLLPDMLTKFSVFFRYILSPDELAGFEIFHTPLVVLLVCVTIASVFAYDFRKSVTLICAGAISHFLIDSVQGPVGYMFLWPLSWQPYTFNIIWSESPIPLEIALSIICLVVIRMLWMKRCLRCSKEY